MALLRHTSDDGRMAHDISARDLSARDLSAVDDSTQDPSPVGPTGPQPAPATRFLRRRRTDRIIGGVAGGLGDYLNVDPVLLRAVFVGLIIFGGAGLILYALGWVLIPLAGEQRSIGEQAAHRLMARIGRVGVVIVAVVAIVVISPWGTELGGHYFLDINLFWALAAVAVGVALLLPVGGRREGAVVSDALAAPNDQSGGAGPRSSFDDMANAVPTQPGAPAQPMGLRRGASTHAPVRRSPLGWFVLAALLFVTAGLAFADQAQDLRLTFSQYLSAGLVVLGIGLVVGTWWGHGRWLILAGFVLAPMALAAAFITVPLEGGISSGYYQPQSAAELMPEYRLVAGSMVIDLTKLKTGTDPVVITASVGLGNLTTILPDDASVTVNGRVDAGVLQLFGTRHRGTYIRDRAERPGSPGGDTISLTLEVGIGVIWIQRASGEAH